MASGLTTLAGELKDAKETDKEKTGTIIVLYDCKAAGQSSSRPHISDCPLRQDHHVRSIKGALLGLCGTHDITQLAIPDAAVFIMFDGYKHGTEGSMLRSFSKCDGRMLEKQKQKSFHHIGLLGSIVREDQAPGSRHGAVGRIRPRRHADDSDPS